ncbi:ATP-binding protein [Streptomyces sp. NPDC000345]|uniref:sensor histidine kinase n=1 Tax=Streptomyces sp. NPDC000345 TaxID=3364537 RepID=UPI0036A4170B
MTRTAPAPTETHIRPQLLRLAVLPPTAVALSACAVVLFTVRSTGTRPGPVLWAVLAGAVAVTGVGILVAAVAAERAARSVSDRIAALRRSSARGEADLRALIEELRRGEVPPPRTSHGGPPGDADDFELLAADLARAHDGAVTAVVQASQLSSQAGSEQKLEVFVNLARRLQSLVHREISILDELENEIEDPALLKGLFHVDHLATRIRRHAENLAVLGGAVSRRQWSNPVSMTEVLRSAIAEVEQYSRVRLVPPIDGELRGHAVADVIHLLAELVENATVFSAPHTQVLLRANLVTSGLAVEVEDRGLGMPVEEQARMNALLADPDQVNVGRLLADGRIGLFVVSQLARRHGIRVRLQSNIYGGVQAVLVVPQALLGGAAGVVVAAHDGGGAPPTPVPDPAGGAPARDATPGPRLPVPARGAVEAGRPAGPASSRPPAAAPGDGPDAGRGSRRRAPAPAHAAPDGVRPPVPPQEQGIRRPPASSRSEDTSTSGTGGPLAPPPTRNTPDPARSAAPPRPRSAADGGRPTASARPGSGADAGGSAVPSHFRSAADAGQSAGSVRPRSDGDAGGPAVPSPLRAASDGSPPGGGRGLGAPTTPVESGQVPSGASAGQVASGFPRGPASADVPAVRASAHVPGERAEASRADGPAPAPLPVRGARQDRPNPADAVPGIRSADRAVVEEHAGIAPVPRVSAVRGTMGKPQLPRRRAQEHIAPQLRGGPAPRPDAEQAAGHDPGLMAAFQRGIGLAEAQQSLEAESLESAPSPAWEPLERSSYPVSDPFEPTRHPAPDSPLLSPLPHPAPSNPTAPQPASDTTSTAGRSPYAPLGSTSRAPAAPNLGSGTPSPAERSPYAPLGSMSPDRAAPRPASDAPSTAERSPYMPPGSTAPASEAPPAHASASPQAYGVRGGAPGPAQGPGRGSGTGTGARTEQSTPRRDGSASAG